MRNAVVAGETLATTADMRNGHCHLRFALIQQHSFGDTVKLARSGGRDRGAAAVEFALIALMLITILFGIFEGGRLWMIQSSLSQAAREGAREMAIHNNHGAATGVIVARASALGVTITPGVTPGTCTSGATVHATASANVGTMTGLLDFAIPGGSILLTGKADMRCGG